MPPPARSSLRKQLCDPEEVRVANPDLQHLAATVDPEAAGVGVQLVIGAATGTGERDYARERAARPAGYGRRLGGDRATR